jgi:HlyD family secretion protein
MRVTARTIGAIILALALATGAVLWVRSRSGALAPTAFHTAAVTRGDLLVSIDATGTVEPEEVIDVGAQVQGKIISFGTDRKGHTVDYGSLVEQATVLARIDDSLYVAEAEQAEARLQSAQASLRGAEAARDQLRAKLEQARRDWERARKLGPSEALAELSYDTYRSTFESAAANLAAGEAEILKARAAIAEAEANRSRARRNLGYCTITAPVRGVVIDRRVNIGQTVVSSMSAPSLFLLAKDLTRMQVWVAVNEADIGKVRPGQRVRFTVDPFPGETFLGEVGKIRLNAAMTQNVVTYTVEIVTDNRDGRLLPYLTANVQFELAQRSGVWLVPNAALRWTPSPGQIAPAAGAGAAGARDPVAAGRGNGDTGDAGRDRSAGAGQGTSATGAGTDGAAGMVWVIEGERVKPPPVRVGLTNGILTEVEGPGLVEGLRVVTGAEVAAEQGAPGGRERSEAVSPFTPQMPRRTGGGGPPR